MTDVMPSNRETKPRQRSYDVVQRSSGASRMLGRAVAAALAAAAAVASIVYAVSGLWPDPDPPAVASPDFRQFISDCEDSLNGWHPGQAVYPHNLTVPLGEKRSYEARVDIRPEAEGQRSPSPDTRIADVLVRCGVGARLVAVGDSVTIDDTDWILRRFDEPGIVTWTWTVEATKPEDSEVRLELRPAVLTVEDDYVIPAGEFAASSTTSFTTDVHVQSTWLRRLEAWWDENWPIITMVAVGIGTAILAVIKWGGDLLVTVRNLLKRLGFTGRHTPSEASPPPPAETPPQDRGASSRGRPPTASAPAPEPTDLDGAPDPGGTHACPRMEKPQP